MESNTWNIWDVLSQQNCLFSEEDFIAEMDAPAITDTTDEYFPQSQEEQAREHMRLLYARLTSENASASEIIENAYEVLWDYQPFDIDDISCLSGGMLVRDQIKGISSTKDILSSILIPNLYSVLLLGAKGQWDNTIGKISLEYLFEHHQFNKIKTDYTDLSRVMAELFPDILRSLFIQSHTPNRGYNVCTQYPKLFLTIAATFKYSPLAPKGKEEKEEEETAKGLHKIPSNRKNTLISNLRFYNTVIDEIAPKDKWNEQSFLECYLFERLFRLRTKFQLFYADFNAEGPSSVPSPSLLADFFFSSPLVFFPEKMLTSLFYKDPRIDKSFNLQIAGNAANFFHFLIQISSIWFPAILSILRFHMYKFGITEYKAVRRFLFPDSESLKQFWEKISPGQIDLSTKMSRSMQTYYSEKWSQFFPTGGYCIDSLSTSFLQEWKVKRPPNSYTASDHVFLRAIQDTLPDNI